MLFPVSYLPSISYFTYFNFDSDSFIESREHFIKQTFRNRCHIYGPNGRQQLIIPVKHDNLFRKAITEVEISFEERWNKNHWRSICAAYRNAPYFEYYETDFEIIFSNPSLKLFDINIRLMELLFSIFKSGKVIRFSSAYDDEPVTQKKYDPELHKLNIEHYHQNFSERHGYIGGLSIIDFLFNMGPDLPALQKYYNESISAMRISSDG